MNPFKKGDWIEILVYKGSRFQPGDFSEVVFVSGEFVDIDDAYGGKRGKKGKNGTQRFHYTELKLLKDMYELER